MQRDLIDVIEFNRPVDDAALDAWLKQRGETLVLSLTNVSDFKGPLFDAEDF